MGWEVPGRDSRAESNSREEGSGSKPAHGGEGAGKLISLAPLRCHRLNGPIVHWDQMRRFGRRHRKAFLLPFNGRSMPFPPGRTRCTAPALARSPAARNLLAVGHRVEKGALCAETHAAFLGFAGNVKREWEAVSPRALRRRGAGSGELETARNNSLWRDREVGLVVAVAGQKGIHWAGHPLCPKCPCGVPEGREPQKRRYFGAGLSPWCACIPVLLCRATGRAGNGRVKLSSHHPPGGGGHPCPHSAQCPSLLMRAGDLGAVPGLPLLCKSISHRDGRGGSPESIPLWDQPRGRTNSWEQMSSLTAPVQE